MDMKLEDLVGNNFYSIVAKEVTKYDGNDKEIKTAYEYLQEISANDKKRMEYEAREKWLMDQRTREILAREEGMEKGMALGKEKGRVEGMEKGRAVGKEEGRVEGMEEGMEKGRAEGLLEVVENALKQGMDMALIEKLTGLSSAEIEKLKRGD